jgi:hypothetical protein
VPGGPRGHLHVALHPGPVGPWILVQDVWSKRASIGKARVIQMGSDRAESRTGWSIGSPDDLSCERPPQTSTLNAATPQSMQALNHNSDEQLLVRAQTDMADFFFTFFSVVVLCRAKFRTLLWPNLYDRRDKTIGPFLVDNQLCETGTLAQGWL